MSRAKYAPASRARRKKILKMAKGQRSARSKWHKIALQSVKRALAYSTIHRRTKKRDFRRLWILRISNACRELGISYSRFMNGLVDSNIHLNRKILAEIAVNDMPAFKKLVDSVQKR